MECLKLSKDRGFGDGKGGVPVWRSDPENSRRLLPLPDREYAVKRVWSVRERRETRDRREDGMWEAGYGSGGEAGQWRRSSKDDFHAVLRNQFWLLRRDDQNLWPPWGAGASKGRGDGKSTENLRRPSFRVWRLEPGCDLQRALVELRRAGDVWDFGKRTGQGLYLYEEKIFKFGHRAAYLFLQAYRQDWL